MKKLGLLMAACSVIAMLVVPPAGARLCALSECVDGLEINGCQTDSGTGTGTWTAYKYSDGNDVTFQIAGAWSTKCAMGTFPQNSDLTWNVNTDGDICNGPGGGKLVSFSATRTSVDFSCKFDANGDTTATAHLGVNAS